MGLVWDTYGLLRSAWMYRLKRGHIRRSRAFYATFLKPGDLAFDVGAHLGDRIDAFRAAGARVVAVEPQPAFRRALKWLYGRDPEVLLEETAVGASPGTATMLVSRRAPTMSTLAADWAQSIGRSARFADVRWEDRIEVPVTTLDALIARHGRPAFTKIDVEGFEADVLAGLSQALPLLSFEVIPAAPDVTRACLDRLDALGTYCFNVSLGESKEMLWPGWRDRKALESWLYGLADDAPSGDVYARLEP